MPNLADRVSRPVPITHGEGCYLFGPHRERYLDFTAGWCVANIGYQHPRVKEALKKEAERGTYVAPFLQLSEWEDFATELVNIAPGKRLARVIRATSGSEAVEYALQAARAATGKETIVSVGGVYHGHTYGAAAVGDAYSRLIGPFPGGYEKIPLPHPSRGVSADQSLETFRGILRQHSGNVAAFLSEPVWSNAGTFIPPDGYYEEIQKLCRDEGILFIMDEVAVGFGRCGILFASSLFGLEPDILCLGKGFTGGYATMAATLVSEDVYEKMRGAPVYNTFGWLPTDLAGTRANVSVILEENLADNAATVGSVLLEELKPLEELPHVAEVRGVGLLLGIEIVSDKASRTADPARADKMVGACAERGLIIETAGNTVFLSPPLLLTENQAKEGAAILKEVLATTR